MLRLSNTKNNKKLKLIKINKNVVLSESGYLVSIIFVYLYYLFYIRLNLCLLILTKRVICKLHTQLSYTKEKGYFLNHYSLKLLHIDNIKYHATWNIWTL